MEKDKVIRHFMGIGYEPILNENTGNVHISEISNMEILISDHRILLHFPKTQLVDHRLSGFANFNEVMDWIKKQYSNYQELVK